MHVYIHIYIYVYTADCVSFALCVIQVAVYNSTRHKLKVYIS